jgi:hypothetical protein
MTNIDFTAWTDAQLTAGLDFATPAQRAEIEAVQASRAGTDDGSHDRVAALTGAVIGQRTDAATAAYTAGLQQ